MTVSGFMNLDRLSELERVLDANDLARLIDAYLDDAARVVTEIGEMQFSRADPDRDEKLHYLTGASLNVGAVGFARLCRDLERAGAGFGPADYQNFCAEFRRVWAVISRWQSLPGMRRAG